MLAGGRPGYELHHRILIWLTETSPHAAAARIYILSYIVYNV